MNSSRGVVALALLSCAWGPSMAAPSWAAFHGYTAGMSKAAAKAHGYGACEYGKGSERKDSVFCELPGNRRSMGALTAVEARLEFKPPELDRVHAIKLKFDVKPSLAIDAVTAVYGPPSGRLGTHDVLWIRGTAEKISIYDRFSISPTTVVFQYDSSLPARLKAASKKEAAKAAVLKDF